jgi:hypothetical protein
VGFEVEAFSVKHEYEDDKKTLKTCNPAKQVTVTDQLHPQPIDQGSEVIFTYDVKFTVRKYNLYNSSDGCRPSTASRGGGRHVLW